jgi:cysteine sulfinate desulfinase/cysteine desulfurase-like protein
MIGADAKDIIFTSGATETNNMSIKGVARFHKEKKRHIITTQTVGHCHNIFLCSSDDSGRSTNVCLTHAEN